MKPRTTITDLQKRKRQGKKIVMVTAYDATFARIVEEAGIDVILVGDSLGMVVQGKEDTLSVTMEEMLYHTRMVASVAKKSLVIADMPFLSYQGNIDDAIQNAGRFLQCGAAAVKLEGSVVVLDRMSAMVEFGIPVMAHLGMTPQSVHQLGGYRIQARSQSAVDQLIEDAKAVESAGVFAVVLEAIPADAAEQVAASVAIPTIGIGAGAACDGQVLVLYDLLGLFDVFVPKFVKQYAHLKTSSIKALRQFRRDVESGKFPSGRESYD
ncbi:MAG: 3-methyl-2-oxobutanoate hydroxymethyltransferase [Nitrospiraceae bacterium]|nr:3-methyl-2-oxobutanoate hydroxymethyltransferase [Nitrospiraceae bacterium]|tara:strand:+ start:5657 stop:6457 length:801 start_codon:yes stop_codon:yes gene_type:complete